VPSPEGVSSTVVSDADIGCGPIAMPEDAQHVLQRTTGVHGFYGASSMERLPVETAMTNQVRKFKAISLKA